MRFNVRVAGFIALCLVAALLTTAQPGSAAPAPIRLDTSDWATKYGLQPPRTDVSTVPDQNNPADDLVSQSAPPRNPPPSVVPPAGPSGDSPSAVAKPPQRVIEKVDARTEVSRTYENSDGSETVEASPERVNFKAVDGSWQPINTRIVGSGAKGVFTNAADSSTVQFAPISAGGVTVTLEDKSVFSFAPDVSGDVVPTMSDDGSTVTYAEVWPGVDVRYRVLPVGVKEDIIVKIPGAAKRVGSGSYGFRLSGAVAGADPKEQTAGLALPSGRILPIAPVSINTGTGPPRPEDARGVITTSATSGSISEGAAGKGTADTPGTVVSVELSRDWLMAQPDKAFPVVVDPTVVLHTAASGIIRTSTGLGECLSAGTCIAAKAGELFGATARAYARYNWNTTMKTALTAGSSVTQASMEVQINTGDPIWPNTSTLISILGNPLASSPGTTTLDRYNYGSALSATQVWQGYLNGSGAVSIPLGLSEVQGWALNDPSGYHDFGIATAETTNSLMTIYWPTLKVTYSPDPSGTQTSPAAWGTVDSSLPVLTATAMDAENDVLQLLFWVCDWDATTSAYTNCWNSGWQNRIGVTGSVQNFSYTVPVAHRLYWGKSYAFSFAINQVPSSVVTSGPAYRPFVTGGDITAPWRVGSDPYSGFKDGVNLAIGSYFAQQTDVAVPAQGPALSMTRSYNSLDTRTGWFGIGWSTPFEMKASWDGVEKLTVSRPDGRQERYGLNPNGTFGGPYGSASKVTLNAGTNAGWKLTDPDQTMYRFDGSGKLLRVTDDSLRCLIFTYNGSNQVILVQNFTSCPETTDPPPPATGGARTLGFTWTGTGSGSTVATVYTDNVTIGGVTSQLTWTYGYSASLLTDVWDPINPNPSGTRTHYTYTSNRLYQWFNPLGNIEVQLTYDANGKVATRKNGVPGVQSSYAYSTTGPYTAHNSSGSYGSMPTHDTTVTDPRSNITHWYFDAQERLASRKNELGASRYWDYGTGGFVGAITYEDSSREDFVSDANGNPIQKTDRWGKVSYKQFDALNRLTWESDARSSSQADTTYRKTYTYDPVSKQVATTTGPSPLGTTTYSYTGTTDAAVGGGLAPPGLLKQTVSGIGETKTYAYSSKGDLMTVTDPAGKITEATYDQLGRQLTKTEKSTNFPSGVAWTMTWDQLSRQATVTEPAVTDVIGATSRQRLTTNTYDANNNLTQVVDSSVTSTIGLRATKSTFDTQDREITKATGYNCGATVATCSWATTTTEYDANDNITAKIDPLTRRYETTFEPRNLPSVTTLKSYQADPRNASTPYDLVVANRGYDAMGRVTSETDAEGRTTVTKYDIGDKVLTRTFTNFDDRSGALRDIVLESNGYDNAGNLTSKYEGNSLRRTTYSYNAAGLKTSQILKKNAVFEQRTGYSYDAAGNFTSEMRYVSETIATPGQDRETRHFFNTAGLEYRTEVENGATDLVTLYSYDSRGLRTSITDPRSNVTDVVFDALGRPTSTKLPSVPNETNGGTPVSSRPEPKVAYNDFGDAAKTADPLGNVTTYAYDGFGRQASITYPSYTPPGGTLQTPTETFDYDNVGNLTSHVDRRAKTSTYSFDMLNRAWKAIVPTGTGASTATSYTLYDKVGNTTQSTDANGVIVNSTFDDLNRPRTKAEVIRQPTTHTVTTTFDYDDVGNQTWMSDPLGHVATAVFSASAKQLSVTDPLGHTTAQTLNSFGDVIKVVDATNIWNEATFDLVGRQVTARQTGTAGGQTALVTAIEYDGKSNRTKQTSPAGRVTQWNFDAANRQTSVVNGFGTAQAVTTQMFYDAAGNNTRIRDGRSNDTILTYQTWNLPEARIEPATIVSQPVVDRQWRRSYTAAGDVTKEEMPGAVRIDRTFDNAGRTLTEVGTGATGSRTFGYDAGGRTTSISHPNATIGVSYEDRGMILQTTGGPQALGVADTTYTYDNARRLTQRVDATGTATFDYDDANRLADTFDPLTGGHTQAWWDDANRNKGRAIVGPGMTGTSPKWLRGTDNYGRILVEAHANAADDSLIQKFYGYDADSNITSEYVEGLASPTDAGNHTYAYDSLNRLTSWTAPGASAVNYAYDGAGNRTQAGAQTFVYDAQNHLTSGAGTTYTWSLRGTMATSVTSGVTTTSTFDVFGLPTAQGATSYTYDGLGRVAKRNGTQTFAYAGVATDPVSDGTWKMAMNATNEVSAIKQGANPATFVGEDQHHDIVALIALNSNNSTGYQAFDPYGVRTSGTGTQPSIGYQSDWTDPTTNDVKMDARSYKPAAGTFTSADSYSGMLNKPVSLNRYTYGCGDPMNSWDPSGHSTNMTRAEFAAKLTTGMASAGLRLYAGVEDQVRAAGLINDPRGWLLLAAYKDQLSSKLLTDVQSAMDSVPYGTFRNDDAALVSRCKETPKAREGGPSRFTVDHNWEANEHQDECVHLILNALNYDLDHGRNPTFVDPLANSAGSYLADPYRVFLSNVGKTYGTMKDRLEPFERHNCLVGKFLMIVCPSNTVFQRDESLTTYGNVSLAPPGERPESYVNNKHLLHHEQVHAQQWADTGTVLYDAEYLTAWGQAVDKFIVWNGTPNLFGIADRLLPSEIRGKTPDDLIGVQCFNAFEIEAGLMDGGYCRSPDWKPW